MDTMEHFKSGEVRKFSSKLKVSFVSLDYVDKRLVYKKYKFKHFELFFTAFIVN